MIIALHGKDSSSKKSYTIQKLLIDDRLKDETVYALDYNSDDSYEKIRESLIENVEYIMKGHSDYSITFVGLSLGGFWAKHLANFYKERAVLVNPSISYYGEFEEDDVDTPLIILLGLNDEVVNPQITIDRYQNRAKLVITDGDHRMHEYFDEIVKEIIFIRDLYY